MPHSNAAPRLVAVLLLGAAPLAHASTTTFERCATIDEDQSRLDCYDEASGRALAGKPAEAASPGAELPVGTGTEPPVGTGTGHLSKRSAGEPTMLQKAWGLEPDSKKDGVQLYRPNYGLVARWTNNTNNLPRSPQFPPSVGPPQAQDSTEAKFQVSFKARLWASEDRRWGVWAAYTQQSQWQVYDASTSRPFRETNYMPEAMVTYAPQMELGDFQWTVLNVGLNHQSNGRSNPLSRSWNRIFAQFGIERGDFALLVTPWYRIPEESNKDDNPDITDYYGYGDITAIYKWCDNTFTATGRGNVRTGKGAAQLTWSTQQLFGTPLRAYVQLFSGYGESLIDYNWKQTTIGAGIALNDLP
jgi:phospholipase A1